MTFEAKEESLAAGRPIYLYLFTMGDTVWRYTSASKDTLAGGNLYKAVQITDDGPSLSGQAATDALTVTAAITIGPAQVWAAGPPATPIQFAILRKHEGDAGVKAVYAGEIVQRNLATVGVVRFTCETTSATMRRKGLRLGWQRQCPYALYDDLTCKVNKATYEIEATVLTVSGFTVTLDSVDDMDVPNYYDGGFVTWVHPTRGIEYRGIESQTGKTLSIFGLTDDMHVGIALKLYPGCGRTATICHEKFDNKVNFGGAEHLPRRSPFDGKPVF